MALNRHHPNHRRIQLRATHRGPWLEWCYEIGMPALDSDADAILKSATIKPSREAYRLTHEQSIKLVEKSYPAYLNRTSGQGTPRHFRPTASVLPFVIFDIIDEALFVGLLKGNVCLKWASLPSGLAGRTIRAGRDACPRIMVELAISVRRESNLDYIIQVLVHQMIHAFLLQCCGHKHKHVSGTGHDCAHSYEYSAIAFIIQTYLKIPATQSSPAYFGCSPIDLVYGYRPVSEAAAKEVGGSICVDHGHGLSWDSVLSYCKYAKQAVVLSELSLRDHSPLDADGIPRPISQYLHIFDNETGKMMPQLRSTYDPNGTYFELHFQNRAIPIARSQITSLPSILNKPLSDPNMDVLTIKVSGDDEETFTRLYSFINTGDYKPAIKDRQDQNLVTENRGPPRLLDYDPECKPYLIADIKVYRLALAMDFPELKGVALKRLEAQSWTNEDPIAALEYIYHGGPIKASKPTSSSTSAKESEAKDRTNKVEFKRADDAIRTWVKKWLMVKSCQPPYTHNLEILQKYSQWKDKYAHNLEILQTHPLWKDKYTKLRERGSELITDIDIVESELAKDRVEYQKLWLQDKSRSRSCENIRHMRDVYGRHNYEQPQLMNEEFAKHIYFANSYHHSYPEPHYYPIEGHDNFKGLPHFPQMVYLPPDGLAQGIPGLPFRRTDGAY